MKRVRQICAQTRAAVDCHNLLVINLDEHDPASYFSDLNSTLVHIEETDCLDRAITIRCLLKRGILHVETFYDPCVLDKLLEC